MRKLIQSLFLLLFTMQVMAQNRAVTGTVTAKEDGLPIPGVSVKLKGSTSGTQTGADGRYSISIPTAAGSTLEFSFIGYGTKEVAVGALTTVNVVLEIDTRQLGEIVITALGISKSNKTLGYAASTVSADDITSARGVTAVSGIQGKVAGVSVSDAGAAGGSTKVIIRGVSSFSGGNNPLYVIDGVPINNVTMNNAFSGSTSSQFSRSTDYGNGANDINPNDIETVTVLKGASATALYGSRAAHGVIMITTKSGKLNQKLQIAYTGSYSASDVLRVPETQKLFGQGWPIYDVVENGSWGPRLDGVVRTWGADLNGVMRKKPYSYVEDNMRNFYDPGNDYTNALSISGGGANSTFIFSYANTSQNGVVPTSADKFTRNNVGFSGTAKYGKFESKYSINYIRKDMNLVFSGQSTTDGGATVFQDLLQIPVDVPITDMKDYKDPYNTNDNYFTVYAQNPYFILNENGGKLQDDRVLGRLDFSYDLSPGLKAIARLGGDFADANIKDHGAIVKYAAGSQAAIYGKAPITGRYTETFRKDNQIDGSLLFQGNYKLNSSISLSGLAGGNYNQRGYNYLNTYVSSLDVPNWYSLANTSGNPVADAYNSRRRLMSVLGELNFGFKDFWYTNLSLRNDWSSTLPVDNRSYFYGGVNTSLVFTDWFTGLRSNKLSYLKLRGAWGQTGNDAAPYLTRTNFITAVPSLPFGNIRFPIGGVAGVTESNNQGNNTLKPEITTEFELGLDTRWFGDRIGIDASFYDRKTKDQIISASFPAETGFTTRTLNIGNIQNKGLELALSLVPLKSTNFRWDLMTNFTTNKSKVLALYGGAQEVNITSAYAVDYVARVGQPLGIYRVPALQLAESGPFAGKTVVTTTGFQKINANAKDDLGTSNPDFIIGFNNKFTYKGISLGAVADWRKGGKFYSYTKQLSTFVGNDPQTIYNYREPFLVPNSVKEVVVGGVVTGYVENNLAIPATSMYSYWYGNTNQYMYRNYVIDKDYFKLREIVLSYALPASITSKLKVSKADISVMGRNLLLITPKSNTAVDPEGSNYGNDISSEFGEFGSAPTMRSFGASLRVTF